MIRRVLLTLAALMMVCTGLALAQEDLYIRRVEGLPEDFFMGMDVSSVLSEEASGVRYHDAGGRERDLFDILEENGINLIRVRVWNDPFDSQGRGYGGGNCDINAAIEIGRRATAHHMGLLVDFHYSDFWADPAKQMVPKAWRDMDIKEKIPALHDWTRECLTKLRDAGVDVAMVQLGNETNGRLCGEKIWMKIYQLMDAGSRAVREVYPDALVAVHFANPESGDNYLSWASKLSYYHLDYDVFMTSYYPYWHGTLDNLKSVLSQIADTYDKKVMVAETSYAWTLEDGDMSPNTIGEGGAYEKPYPFTVQGQANHISDVIGAMADIGGIGVCWWEGAWVPVGRDSREENQALWQEHGSGWASSYAGEYDPDDAGVYYGGCACDNQTLFDFSGRALPSLSVFRMVREGQTPPVTVDALDEPHVYCDLNGPVALPDTVDAVMSDNSRQAVPVTWEAIDPEALKAAGPAAYEIHGTAEGREAVLTLHMVRFNYVLNGSFEEEDVSMWRCTDLGQTEQLYCEEKKTDSLTGLRHWHFYSAQQDTVEFELEQDISALPAGTYEYRISIQGGDCGETDIYSYVKIDGEMIYTQPASVTKWNDWHTPAIGPFSVEDGQAVTVGIHVRCGGKGAWGKIDDAELTSAGE